jgi:hypothetical protein
MPTPETGSLLELTTDFVHWRDITPPVPPRDKLESEAITGHSVQAPTVPTSTDGERVRAALGAFIPHDLAEPWAHSQPQSV